MQADQAERQDLAERRATFEGRHVRWIKRVGRSGGPEFLLFHVLQKPNQRRKWDIAFEGGRILHFSSRSINVPKI